MQTLYKLTDSCGYTYNHTYWEEGTTHILPPTSDPEMCSSDVLHAYVNYNLGLLVNIIHAGIPSPRLWECVGDIVTEDAFKIGTFELEVVRELDLPNWYTDRDLHRKVCIQFAILCARAVLPFYGKPDVAELQEILDAAQEYVPNAQKTPPSELNLYYDATIRLLHEPFGPNDSIVDTVRHMLIGILEYSHESFAAFTADYASQVDEEHTIDFANLANQAVRMVMEKE